MTYLTTFTLDELKNIRMMEQRLLTSGCLDNIGRPIRKAFLVALSDYLIDRGSDVLFKYKVSTVDIDNVIIILKNGLPSMSLTTKKEFTISESDAKRIVDSLEFSADWDKTEIYYKLKFWLDERK